MHIFSVGTFPVWSGSSLKIIPVSLGAGKLSINREYFLHVRCSYRILAYLAGMWMNGVSVCLSVFASVHAYICWYICTSVCNIE